MNKKTALCTRKPIVQALALLLAAGQLGLLAPNAQAQSAAALASDVIRRQSQYSAVQQAVYQLVAEAIDADNDGTPEVPVMKLGTGGPADGGVIPDASGAPKTDGFGGLLGYCAWDNGTATVSAGRRPGSGAPGALAVAVISYGLDNQFQTSCADVAAGVMGGDDYAFWMTANQMATTAGGTTSTYWSAPLADLASLMALPTAGLHDGEVRLTKDTNRIYRWEATTQQWRSLGGGGSNWVDSGLTDTYLANGKAAIGQSAVGAEKLVLNGGATSTALGLNGSGASTGVNIYNQTGSAVTAFLGYDHTTSKMVIDVQTGAFAIKAGGAERFSIGVDGAVVVNGYTVLDASRNLTAGAGAFSGNLSTTGALAVGGATVIDASRNLVNINAITATGNANVGSLSIGGASVIDSGRNATLNSLTTTGTITANGGISTTTLTATAQLMGPSGSAAVPAFSFSSSASTGMYSPSANALGLTAGGTQVLAATAANGVTLPAGLTVSGGNLVLSSHQASGTYAARPLAGTAGRIYVTTDTNEIYRDSGGAWVRVGASRLAAMNDTAVTSPTAGQLLAYNASSAKWVNSNLQAGSGIAVTASDGSITVGLTNVGTAGTYGSATKVPVITTDAQGRVTGVTDTNINFPDVFGYTPTRSNGDGYSVVSQDTRAVNSAPQDRDAGAYFDFKNNTADSLADGGVYHGVMTFRSYGAGTDFTGGKAHQLAFTDNGGLWQRSGTGSGWAGWRSVSPRAATSGLPLKTCVGQTPQNATSWQQYADNMLYVDVIFPANCGFTQPPVILSSIYGNGGHFALTGGSAPYFTGGGFRIYIRPSAMADWAPGTITPAYANAASGWGINWVAYGV